MICDVDFYKKSYYNVRVEDRRRVELSIILVWTGILFWRGIFHYVLRKQQNVFDNTVCWFVKIGFTTWRSRKRSDTSVGCKVDNTSIQRTISTTHQLFLNRLKCIQEVIICFGRNENYTSQIQISKKILLRLS